MMRIARYVVAAVLLVIAALQINDPDPLFWLFLYGGAAVMIALAAHGRSSPLGAGVMIGAAIAALLLTLPGFVEYFRHPGADIVQDMSPDRPWIESTREFLGALLTLVALALLARGRAAQKS
ncbi:MAG: transmembrane 220 family protein [Pseudomonadota bacterium]